MQPSGATGPDLIGARYGTAEAMPFQSKVTRAQTGGSLFGAFCTPKSSPQGLKARRICTSYGTAGAVPFQSEVTQGAGKATADPSAPPPDDKHIWAASSLGIAKAMAFQRGRQDNCNRQFVSYIICFFTRQPDAGIAVYYVL